MRVPTSEELHSLIMICMMVTVVVLVSTFASCANKEKEMYYQYKIKEQCGMEERAQ